MSHFKPLTAHTKFQLRRLLRNPGFWIPTILFPTMLYSFFGASLPSAGLYSQFAIASFAVYAVLGIAFFQFGSGIAQDREDPFDPWMRTLPHSAAPNVIAQILVAGLLSLAAVTLVLCASYLFGKTQLSLLQSAGLIAICAALAVPAALMGVALGYAASAKAATAVANLVFLPLSFLGGLWLPPIIMPELVRNISVWTPTRQMAEFAWGTIQGQWPHTNYILGLLAYTAAFALLAVVLIKRDKLNRFG